MAVCPTALHPVLDLTSPAQLPQKARAPECQKYWWGQGNMVGIICLPNFGIVFNMYVYVKICVDPMSLYIPAAPKDCIWQMH